MSDNQPMKPILKVASNADERQPTRLCSREWLGDDWKELEGKELRLHSWVHKEYDFQEFLNKAKWLYSNMFCWK